MHIVRNSTMVQIIRSAKDAGYKAHTDVIEPSLKIVLDDHSKLERENKNLVKSCDSLIRTVDQLVADNQRLVSDNRRLEAEPKRAKAYCVMASCPKGSGVKHVLTPDYSLEICVKLLQEHLRSRGCADCEYFIEEF